MGDIPPRSALAVPDSFKGTFSAGEVAEAMARGLAAAGFEATAMPAADGGEGTLDALLASLGGEPREAEVSDPLGRPVGAAFALLGDGRTAIVEVAAASGLGLVAEDERDAWKASSHGTGELIAAAAAAGAERVLLAAGGSATTDGGAGVLAALEATQTAVEIEVICDVTVPFEDAPRIFGPQKGAGPELVGRLERRLEALAAELPRDPRGHPMTGAAGGLAGGLWAAHGARLVAGAPYVLDVLGFDRQLRTAGLVITGEGRIDAQTPAGKLVGEVAARCAETGVPCHVVAGRDELGVDGAARLGLRSVREAGNLAEIETAARAIADAG